MNVDRLTGISAASFGVYVHFPYCLAKCPYCDFASIRAPTALAEAEERYTEAMLVELALRGQAYAGRGVDSVFFGGGTPSLWAPRHVERVLRQLRSNFRFAPDAEVTLEANPGAVDRERFRAYRELGFNRLSIGGQSFSPKLLRALGRSHGPEEIAAAVDTARTAGFEDISLDFIYGIPGQTVELAREDAQRAVALAPTHLSAYALTLGEESLAMPVPLGKAWERKKVPLPEDADVVQLQREIAQVYQEAGFHRYEVSNYAKPGFHSRHNALYWTQGECFAVGVGAVGTLEADGRRIRYSNARTVESYVSRLALGELPETSRELLSKRELFVERLMLGLRLVNGVDVANLCLEVGEPFEERARNWAFLEKHGLGFVQDGRWALTPRGFDVHFEVCSRIL